MTLWLWVKVKVMQNGIMFIILPSLTEIGLQVSKPKSLNITHAKTNKQDSHKLEQTSMAEYLI